MKLSTKLLIGIGCIAATFSTTVVQADTGSDLLFNTKIAQLQHEIGMRNQLDDELIKFRLARGYSSPEALDPQVKTMLARADDDAFTHEMHNLHQTMKLYDAIASAD